MSELRRDPILRRWVIIAPERPGDLAPRRSQPTGSDTPCPFCPGNEHLNPVEILRVGDADGWQVRITPDRHPLLRIEGEPAPRAEGMFDRMNPIGAHELVTDTPEHARAWADLSPAHLVRLLSAYRDRLHDLRRDPRFRYVMVLKNRGAIWSRYRHAHSHIVATPFRPKRIEEELAGAREYHRRRERCVFCDQVDGVLDRRQLLVAQRGDFVSWTPYASAYPYETWLAARPHAADFGTVRDGALLPLAELLKETLARMRAACVDPPYSLAVHSGALDGSDATPFHWHIEIVPHLGSELGMEWATGIFSNPVAPEEAAQALRSMAID